MRTFVFLTLLLVSSICIENKPDSVNEIIDELLELNRVVLTPAQQVGRLVSQIMSSGKECANAFNSFYAKVKNNCELGSKQLKRFQAKIEGDLVTAKVGINAANARVTKNTAAVAKLTGQIKSARQTLKNAHKRHRMEQRAFRHTLAEAEGKLIAIRHVRNIVVDELLNAKSPASLVQVNTITAKLQELKTLVAKDNDSMFTTVVGGLLELVSMQNLNDQSILKKFLASLAQLSNRIRSWRKKAIKANHNIRKLNHATNAARLRSLRALGKLLVVARSSVVAAHRTVDELNNSVLFLNRVSQRKARGASHWASLCNDQARVANIFQTEHQNLGAHMTTVQKALLSMQ
jgi:hypothetical protein